MQNVEDLAMWFSAAFYKTDFRPVPLEEYIRADRCLYSSSGDLLHERSDKLDATVGLCVEGIRKGQQLLIFCSSKRGCEVACSTLLEYAKSSSFHFTHAGDAATTDRLRQQLQQKLSDPYSSIPLLSSCLQCGVAFHHANLAEETRSLIELAFKAGSISIIVATSTLATGVNLPAGRVIVKGLNIGRDLLSVITYRQMCGRAGRAGQALSGESYLVVERGELSRAKALVSAQYPPVRSQLNPSADGGRGLLKVFLELCCLGLCRTVEDILNYAFCTLWHYSRDASSVDIRPKVMASILFLVKTRLLDSSKGEALPLDSIITPSRFGQATMESGLNPDESIAYYEDFLLAHEGLNLQTNLHVLYLITSLDNRIVPDFKTMW
jgi:DNA polymerase theta